MAGSVPVVLFQQSPLYLSSSLVKEHIIFLAFLVCLQEGGVGWERRRGGRN